jgi:glutamyl-tRNA synthetase
MITLFDIGNVNASASTFNPDKLRWLNQQHIIRMPSEELGGLLVPFLDRLGLDSTNGPRPANVAEGFRERAETLIQMAESCRYCYEDFDEIEPKAAKKHLRPVTLAPLVDIRSLFGALDDWSRTALSTAIEDCAKAHSINLGKLGQPLRVAVTGGSVSPPIDVTLALVGRERTLARLDKVIELIRARAENA